MSEILKIIAIKTGKCVYISDNINNENYHHSKLSTLYFDNNLAKKTYEKEWLEVPQIPDKIETVIKGRKINEKYTLKSEFLNLNLDNQKEIDFFRCKNDCYDCDCENSKLKVFYDYSYDMSEDKRENVPFEITVIEEENNFEITKKEFNLQFNLIDRLKFNPVLLPTRPCYLTKLESYNIIRNHIKTNINGQHAGITSDYDFCFTVKKKIRLSQQEEYFVDINNTLFQKRKRKPLMEKRYVKNREVEVFEMAPKEYQKYTVIKEFTGTDVNDLKNNIKTYLDELMQMINSPLTDCPHCKGEGVIIE